MPIGFFFQLAKGFRVLLFLNIAQLILYIGGLALIGQGLLFVLSGQKRETNLFYQLFQIVNKPWSATARFISPKQIADHQNFHLWRFVLWPFYILR